MKAPVCPKCGRQAFGMETRYGVRHRCCDLWSWDGAPLVDAATHEARKAAHAAFDTLWKRHGMTRSQAYRALSAQLGIKPKDCHMKLMSAEMALRVPKAVMSILDQYDPQVIE